MIVDVHRSYADLCAAEARRVVSLLQENPTLFLCIAAGDTPVGLFRELTRAVTEGRADFSLARFVALDEWAGLSVADPRSCTALLERELIGLVLFDRSRVCVFDGAAGPEAECERVAAFLDRHGPVDYMFLGVGLNGHLGLNEPGSSEHTRTRVVETSQTTRSTAHKYGLTPHEVERGMTLGLSDIMEAGELVIAATGAHKAHIVRSVVEDDGFDAPASLIRSHAKGRLLLDQAAASLLGSGGVRER